MLSWFKRKLDDLSDAPDLAEWERTCPECAAEDRHLHDIFCPKETCPFCTGQLATCDCINEVLKLSSEEIRVRENYVDDSAEPLLAIMERWSVALEDKGRIPYRANPLPYSADGLILAAARGSLPFVRTLLIKGLAIDAANDVGYVALMAAARSYQVDVVRYLLNKGANVHSRNHYGHSPLHCAVMTPTAGLNEAMAMQAECVRLLLRSHADVNAVDESGGTPLMKAAWFGCAPSVALLLKAGAHVNLKGARGMTAQELALERGHAAIAQSLAKNGG